jgi:hypothetical protein
MRLSTTGRLLEEVALDPSLSFGDEQFTHVRVGRDGKVYQMQITQRSWLRVARFALGGGPNATPSPSPAAVSPSPTATTSGAAVSPSVSASATPAAIPAPDNPGGSSPPADWLLLAAGLLSVAAAGALLIWRRRMTPRSGPAEPPLADTS